jgi:hypothetical protein
MLTKLTVIVLFGLSLAFTSPVVFAAEKGEADAILAAENFLRLLDEGNYEASLAATSDLHQAKVPKILYLPYIGSTRSSFGSMINRSAKKVSKQTTAFMLPDGDYFFIQYESSFQHKKIGHESVTVALEADGKWRVCDYQVR